MIEIPSEELTVGDEIALFAGDMFNDEIFFDIIDLLEKYLKPILIKHPEYFKT